MTRFSDDEIINAAKLYIDSISGNWAYPVVPTDEWGNPESYESGCVPWVVCQGFTVKDCIVEVDGEAISVIVTIDWTWDNGEEDEPVEEADVQLSFLVEVEDGELVFGIPERID